MKIHKEWPSKKNGRAGELNHRWASFKCSQNDYVWRISYRFLSNHQLFECFQENQNSLRIWETEELMLACEKHVINSRYNKTYDVFLRTFLSGWQLNTGIFFWKVPRYRKFWQKIGLLEKISCFLLLMFKWILLVFILLWWQYYVDSEPSGSMYGMFTYIYHINQPFI